MLEIGIKAQARLQNNAKNNNKNPTKPKLK
jgi:hypothetical protein